MNDIYCFTEGSDSYGIRPERRRSFHGDKPSLMYYGMKNGLYVRGTTSYTPEGSLKLLIELLKVDESNIVWKN